MPRENVSLRIPEIGFIAGTRAALGAGLGLLLADKLNRGQRKRVGWVLVTIGAVTSIPIIVNVLQKRRPIDIAA